MMYGHPYATLLLALTQFVCDEEYADEYSLGEGHDEILRHAQPLMYLLEDLCDVSFRDK
jgi:hypothetical protein